MFIGHFAVGFAVKNVAPRVSLGTLFLAASLIDCIWPLLLLLGIERVAIVPGNTAFTPLEFVHYPYTHSLLMTCLWAVLAGTVYWGARRNAHDAAWVGLAVLSHWVLDAITHRPDLPLYPGSPQLIGFGLWNSVPGTLIVEGLMFAAALSLYVRASVARDKIGVYALWGLVAVLLVAYAGAAFGPLPPDIQTIAYAGLLGGGLSVACGYWIDRHRSMIQSTNLALQS